MNTAQRNASRAKRRYAADPSAMYRVFGRIQPFTPSEQLRLNLPPRVAYESLRTGKGEEGDFHTMAAAINVAMVLAESIDPLVEQTALLARDALMRVLQRHHATGRWGFNWQDLRDIPPALELYEELVAKCTPIQMQAAMTETIRCMQAGDVLEVQG